MANKIVENPWNPLAHLCIKGWEGKLRESRQTALILCLVELLNSGESLQSPSGQECYWKIGIVQEGDIPKSYLLLDFNKKAFYFVQN